MHILNFNIHNPETKDYFEKIYTLIERHKLNSNNNINIEELEKSINIFKNHYDEYKSLKNKDFEQVTEIYIDPILLLIAKYYSHPEKNEKEVQSYFINILAFLSSLLMNQNPKVYKAFFDEYSDIYFPKLNQLFLRYYNLLLQKRQGNKDIISQWFSDLEFFDISSIEIGQLISSKILNIKHPINYNINSTISLKNNYLNKINLNTIIDSNKIDSKKLLIPYIMILDLKIEVENNDAIELTYILISILSPLSNVKNVKLEYEDIKTGSLIARINIYIKGFEAKKEVQRIMSTLKEGIVKLSTAGMVSHTGTIKTEEETGKIIAERKKIEYDLENSLTKEQRDVSNLLDIKSKELDIKMKELELEKATLENESLKLKNLNDKIDLTEKLASTSIEALNKAKAIQIKINDVVYIEKDNGKNLHDNTQIEDIS